MLESYGKLPLVFELNQGQSDREVKFLARGPGYTLFLTPTEAVFAFCKPHQNPSYSTSLGSPRVRGVNAERAEEPQPDHIVLRMQLLGARSEPLIMGVEELSGKNNYFLGNNPKKWHTNVATYSKVKYHDVYPGVDLVYYGNQGQLEYDFIVGPGADPKAIALVFEGVDRLEVDVQGDLLLHAGEAPVRFHKPSIYQEVDGSRRELAGGYLLENKHQVRFHLGVYDSDRALVIDPVLAYSTYLGGSANESGSDIAVDSAGNAYVTGITTSFDFPAMNPLKPAPASDGDVFVTKIDPTGSALVYSTYLGGSRLDRSLAISIDSGGNAYITGGTNSTDFPTVNPLMATPGGCPVGGRTPLPFASCDAFVAKLSPTGTALVYSTYLGGSGIELSAPSADIAVDSLGNAHVIGDTRSTDFPTANAFQPTLAGARCVFFKCQDAFVSKLNASGSTLVYSTYLGGSGADGGHAIALDPTGSAYVAGTTFSTDFPTAAPLQPALAGGQDFFVAKLTPNGSALIYSTYLGGSGTDGTLTVVSGEVFGDATLALDVELMSRGV